MEDISVVKEVMEQLSLADKNDKARKTSLQYMLTRGVKELPDIGGLIHAVREFSTFTEDNDPYGEHDYGSLSWFGQKVCWKIDYYDQSLTYGCDPRSEKCRRIITVMLPMEY